MMMVDGGAAAPAAACVRARVCAEPLPSLPSSTNPPSLPLPRCPPRLPCRRMARARAVIDRTPLLVRAKAARLRSAHRLWQRTRPLALGLLAMPPMGHWG
eukprot:scaffold735_cov376-Prasinococcus_capsulatus_cf.AAC.28